jgi:MFS family permease
VARGGASEQAAKKTTFRDVFAVPEFRALWLAQLLSVAGDQLARVALTILVYDRTRSALLAAITFVVSIVPTFIGGVTLAWLADRYPRRRVMIVCDLVRAVLVLVMALPGMPIAARVALLFVVTLAGAPFTSARAALYPDVLTGDRYLMGTAVTLTTLQFAQVLGFAAGGAIVGLFGIRTSLVVDAATFVASALIVRAWVRARPAPVTLSRQTDEPSRSAGVMGGIRLVFANRTLRTTMLFGWLAAFYDAPEGVAAPLSRSLGGGSTAVGLLLAAEVLGSSIGSLAFGRMVSPSWRLRVMGPLAIVSCAVLMLFAFSPSLVPALVILCVSGVFTCFQLAANAAFVSAAPTEQRSQAFGLAVGGMSLGQGTVMILAGAVAGRYAPSAVIAVVGALGTVVALVLALNWHADTSRDEPQTRQHRKITPAPKLRRFSSGPVGGAHVACPLLWVGGAGLAGSGPVGGAHVTLLR